MKQLAIKHPDKHVRRVGNKRKDVRAPTVSEPLLGFLLSLPALRFPPPAGSARTVISILKRKDRAHISLPNSSLWNVAEDFTDFTGSFFF